MAGALLHEFCVVTPKNSSSDFLHVTFKVPEGQHPRGTTLREALRGNLPVRGFSGASVRVSSRVLQGLCGALRGSSGVRGILRGLVTLFL